MVRCDEFYEKWRRCGNFCEKDPDTAAQIDAYLDQLQEIQEIAADCLSEEEFAAMAEMQISEKACRPVVSEKDSELRGEAVRQIVKLAVQKAELGEKVAITCKEVLQILDSIRHKPLKIENMEMAFPACIVRQPEPDAPKDTGLNEIDLHKPMAKIERSRLVTGGQDWESPEHLHQKKCPACAAATAAGRSEPGLMRDDGFVEEPVPIRQGGEPTAEQKAILDEYLKEVAKKPTFPPVMQNESAHIFLTMNLNEMYCPQCHASAKEALVWKCCNLLAENAAKLAEEAVEEHLRVAAEKSRLRRMGQ